MSLLDDKEKKNHVIQPGKAQIFSFVGNTTSVFYSLSAHESEKQPVNVDCYEINPEKKMRGCRAESPKKGSKQGFPLSTIPSFRVYSLFNIMKNIRYLDCVGSSGIVDFSSVIYAEEECPEKGFSAYCFGEDLRKFDSLVHAVRLVNKVWEVEIATILLCVKDVGHQAEQVLHTGKVYIVERTYKSESVFDKSVGKVGRRDGETGELVGDCPRGRYCGILIAAQKYSLDMVWECMKLTRFDYQHPLFQFLVSQILRLLHEKDFSKEETSELFLSLVEASKSLPKQMGYIKEQLEKFGMENLHYQGILEEHLQKILSVLGT